MKALVLAGIAALALSGCQTTDPTVLRTQRLTPVEIPERLYNCPNVPKLPDVSKLTDRQVAAVIVKLYNNNVTCKNSEAAIRRYVAEVKRTVR